MSKLSPADLLSLERYSRERPEFRAALASGDAAAVEDLLARGKRVRDALGT